MAIDDTDQFVICFLYLLEDKNCYDNAHYIYQDYEDTNLLFVKRNLCHGDVHVVFTASNHHYKLIWSELIGLNRS